MARPGADADRFGRTHLRLTVQGSVALASIRELSVFHVNRPVPKLAYREGGRPLMRAPGVSRSRDGHFAIDCPTPDWEIRYTLDGSEPTRPCPVYREPQPLPVGGALKARYFDTEAPAAPGGPVLTRAFGLPPSQITVVRASSEEPDTPATAAFDGDPKTMWHTAWRNGAALPPHEIVIDLGQAWPLTGIGYLSRQDAVGNFPKGIRVWASDTAGTFSEKPQFEGDFGLFKTEPHAWRQVHFPRPVRGRNVRIVYPDEVNNTKCVASAEIDVLVRP